MELHKLKAEGFVKMWQLTEVSVYPKSLERQSVETCLRVFCEETYTAIINHPGIWIFDGREHTAVFIKTAVNWWKYYILRV